MYSIDDSSSSSSENNQELQMKFSVKYSDENENVQQRNVTEFGMNIFS